VGSCRGSHNPSVADSSPTNTNEVMALRARVLARQPHRCPRLDPRHLGIAWSEGHALIPPCTRSSPRRSFAKVEF
jgi:hypothetical protein